MCFLGGCEAAENGYEAVYYVEDTAQREDDLYELDISSTKGGEVVNPGEGTFEYYDGSEVEVVVEDHENHTFAGWTGDVPDEYREKRELDLVMDKDRQITANFVGSDTDPFDWVISMDSSGSMDWTDPEDIRLDGAIHFVDQVEEYAHGSQGAVIEFNSAVQLMNNLTDDYDAIRDDLASIVSGGGPDNFENTHPLELALEEFKENGNESRNWYHLMVTNRDFEDDEEFWELVDEYEEIGIPIFPIGFILEDDTVMKEMANRTDGRAYSLDDPEECIDASQISLRR